MQKNRNRANDGIPTCSKTGQIYPNSLNSKIDDSQNLRHFVRKHGFSQKNLDGWCRYACIWLRLSKHVGMSHSTTPATQNEATQHVKAETRTHATHSRKNLWIHTLTIKFKHKIKEVGHNMAAWSWHEITRRIGVHPPRMFCWLDMFFNLIHPQYWIFSNQTSATCDPNILRRRGAFQCANFVGQKVGLPFAAPSWWSLSGLTDPIHKVRRPSAPHALGFETHLGPT